MVKVDANGTQVWDETHGGASWDEGGGLTATDDGGYVLTGWTAGFGAQARDVYMVKTNSAGVKQWENTFGGEHKSGAGSVIQTSDGGYLMVGSTENTYFSVAWRSDGYIIKTDDSGNLEWSQVYGGINDEGFGCVRDAGDGGFVISGSANSYGNDSEVYFLKINDSGEVTSVTDYGKLSLKVYMLLQNYPNPFNNQTLIQFNLPKGEHIKLEIFNIQGKRIKVLLDGYQNAGLHTIPWTSHDMATGIYFYRLKAGDFNETKRMLLLK